MQYQMDVPNTIICETGEVIFVNAWQVTDSEMDGLLIAERIVERTETKYGTNDFGKMIDDGISKKDLRMYLDARCLLTKYKRY